MGAILTWQLVIAILLTAIFIGRILDAALHRYYDETIKNWLFERAIRFDEGYSKKLIHEERDKALSSINRLFGAGSISRFLILTSLIPLTAVLVIVALIDPERMVNSSWYSLNGGGAVISVAALNIIADHLSLAITRRVLAQMKDSLSSLVGWLALEIMVVAVLGPAPMAFTAGFVGLDSSDPWSYLMCLIMGAAFVGLFYSFLSYMQEGLTLGQFLPLAMVSGFCFITASMPILIHIHLLVKDILRRQILRPIFRLVSGLLEDISGEEHPMTWILTTLGAVPVLIKVWRDVLFN